MKRLRGFLIGIFALVMGAFMVSTPVFADPDTTTDTPETVEVTEGEEGEETEEPAEIPTCAEQIDKLSWIVCPGTGLLANMIDGAYNVLTYLIQIDPIPNDTDSPFHLIWTYCRNLTNVLFIVVLLLCILSQITGVGISNVGIKRMLPRLIMIVILSNISYILCEIAVDLSNILGAGLSGIFETVQDQAIASGAISLEFHDIGAGAIIAHFLGIGTIAATSTVILANVGGVAGLIWLLLPIILSGALAVLSAVLTMAARQSLIYLLVMISPLAIVAYALPNTESWAQKWYSMLMRMLFFYPMFTLMYSASRLAGLVIMSSATGMEDSTQQGITIILGLAVQLIPLFLSIPMMKLSGTFLGKISGIVNKVSAPVVGSFNNMALERRKHAIENLRSGYGRFPNTPHAHLARYLQQRKTDRINETRELEGINRDTYERRYVEGYYDRKGQVTKRGEMHYRRGADQVENTRIVKQIDTDFDAGFGTNPNALSDRLNRKNYRAIRDANEKLDTELDLTEIVNARADYVRRQNTESRAVHLRDAITGKSESEATNRQVRKLINDSFHVSNAHEQTAARNSVLARAITQKRKADTETRSEYLELYDDYPAGNLINEALEQSFKEGDYNSLEAAIQIMTKRGDQNLITETIEKMTREAESNILTRNLTNENSTVEERNRAMRFQKHLLDSTLTLKSENIVLASWSKANMIRRAKHEAGQNVAGFIGIADYLNSVRIGEEDKEEAEKLGAKRIIDEYANGKYFITQDRTTFKVIEDFRRDGIISGSAADIFREKDVRSGLASGEMDGELLGNALDLFTSDFYRIIDFGKVKSRAAEGGTITLEDVLKDIPTDETKARKFQRSVDFFKDNRADALKWVKDQLVGMNSKQLAGQKSTAVKVYNALLGLFGEDGDGFDRDGNSKELRKILKSKIAGITSRKGNGSTLRNAMNPDVKKILGVPEEDEIEEYWNRGLIDPDAPEDMGDGDPDLYDDDEDDDGDE